MTNSKEYHNMMLKLSQLTLTEYKTGKHIRTDNIQAIEAYTLNLLLQDLINLLENMRHDK